MSVITRIADPVLNSLSKETLRKNMPVECSPGNSESRKEVTYLEAFGRLVAGVSPWLELGEDSTNEGFLRKKHIYRPEVYTYALQVWLLLGCRHIIISGLLRHPIGLPEKYGKALI